jgi:hypothetical protein
VIYIARPIQRFGITEVEVTRMESHTVESDYFVRPTRWAWWYGFLVGAVVVALLWFVSLNP